MAGVSRKTAEPQIGERRLECCNVTPRLPAYSLAQSVVPLGSGTSAGLAGTLVGLERPHRLCFIAFRIRRGSALYPILGPRLAIYAPRLLRTLGCPPAIALRCDQLLAGRAPRGAPMLSAYEKTPDSVSRGGFENLRTQVSGALELDGLAVDAGEDSSVLDATGPARHQSRAPPRWQGLHSQQAC